MRGGGRASEERQQHLRELAEGAEEDVGEAGADRAGHDEGTAGNTGGEKSRSAHPQEPAEGGEEDVEAPGADRAGDDR